MLECRGRRAYHCNSGGKILFEIQTKKKGQAQLSSGDSGYLPGLGPEAKMPV